MTDVVYVVTNSAMPGLVKIGITQKSIEQRLKELDQTGVPLPFECFYAAIVSDCRAVERALHEAFDDHRVRKSREFFRLSPEKPRAIIRLLAKQEVTPGADVVETADDQRALDEERERRSKFDFGSVGIPVGAELSSVFDEKATCTVANSSKVLFRGDLTSLSRSALVVAHENGFRWKAVQGPAYWKYQGKTLDEHRQEEGEE
ncbi:MAG: GIY-YIG nuclease family protein [Hyphomonadaceae bacterium]|nr:GIY-YIG nuclease family protein [Hyphomonadaceae bacterium]